MCLALSSLLGRFPLGLAALLLRQLPVSVRCCACGMNDIAHLLTQPLSRVKICIRVPAGASVASTLPMSKW